LPLKQMFEEAVLLIVYALLAAIATLGVVTLTSAIVESHRRRF